MVIQQDKPVILWGWDKAGQTLTATLDGNSASVTADAQGQWKLTLPPMKSGGPYDLTLNGSSSVTLTDILAGEVWVASGQSNMEFPMHNTHDAAQQIPQAQYPQIRLFTVEKIASLNPSQDVKGVWKVCAPDTVPDFSAVAYHFGKDIHQTLKVPVGLIADAWSGSPAETWIPPQTLEKDQALADMIAPWEKQNEGQLKTWTQGMDYDLWFSDIRLIPKDGKSAPATIELGQAKNPGQTNDLGAGWNHSEKPGSTGAYTMTGSARSGNGPAGRYSGVLQGGAWGGITAYLSRDQKAVDLSAYEAIEFWAKGNAVISTALGQPSIADYDYYGSDAITLTSDWKLYRIPITALHQGGWGITKPFTQDQVSVMTYSIHVSYWPDIQSLAYNGMIAPLTSFPIRGVIWYQGESNTGRPYQYHTLLSAMIKGWRQAWDEGDFPFLIVQLPNYMKAQPQPSESSWAELREAQLQTLDQPNTGMITTIDLGDPNNVHPRNKTEVGRRLSLAALKLVYGKKIVASGPVFRSMKAVDGKLVLSFDNIGGGLKSGGDELQGFAVAGADGPYHWAKARIHKNQVEIWSDDVKEPARVRYAWADNPICDLFNKEGLPASPFQASLDKTAP